MKKRKSYRRFGFTLIEVVVVIVILVTLASIATPLYMNNLKKAKRDAAKVDINNLKQQVELFRAHVGRCPEEWQELITRPEENEDWSGPYLEKEPVDPWGKKYIYRRTEDENHDYEIISCGPDGNEGTEDDIKSFAGSEETGK